MIQYGRFLVVAQVTGIVVLLLLGWQGMVRNALLMLGVVCATFLGIHAVMMMRWKNLRATPEPGEHAELCELGIYGLIRHPMYAASLLGAGMFALGAGSGWAYGLWVLLVIVLWVKLRREESLWLEKEPAYAGYMKRTKRLIPFLL